MREAESIVVPGRAQPLAAYPHAKRAGDFIFCSGTSARRPDGAIEGGDDIGGQTQAVIENLRAILQAAGADLEDLVEINVFPVDMADYAGFNAVYNRYFEAATGPARTTVGVRSLPGPALKIEMRAVAYAPKA